MTIHDQVQPTYQWSSRPVGLQEEAGVLTQHPTSLEAAAKEAEQGESLGGQPVSQLIGKAGRAARPSLSETTPHWKRLEMGVGAAQALLPAWPEVSLGCRGQQDAWLRQLQHKNPPQLEVVPAWLCGAVKVSSLREQGRRPGCEGLGWQRRAPALCLCPGLRWAFPDCRGAGAGRVGWKFLEERTGLSSCS